MGNRAMSTVLQSRPNRLTKRVLKRYRKGTADFVHCVIVDDPNRDEWRDYSVHSTKQYGKGTSHFFRYLMSHDPKDVEWLVSDDPKQVEWHSIVSILR